MEKQRRKPCPAFFSSVFFCVSRSESAHFQRVNDKVPESEEKLFDPEIQVENDSDEKSLVLSPYDQRLLRITWSDDFIDLFELGTEIYFRIFKAEPSVQTLFKCVSKNVNAIQEAQNSESCSYSLFLDSDTLKENKEFKDQALKFVQTLSKAVSSYSVGNERAKDFDSYLKNLGKWHRTLTKAGFKSEFWDVFQRVLCEIMKDRIEGKYTVIKKPLNLTDSERVHAGEIWDKLGSHVIGKMKDGYFSA